MTEPHLFLYKAFISHCEADKSVGDWLARSLQDFRVGRAIVGKDTHAGKIFAGLGPIFSRQADDGLRPLSTDVVNALFGAQFLIVVASHDCPKSEQVNKEIRLFKHYHGESRILYLVMEDTAGKYFPAAALFHVDADGALTAREAHPGQIIKGTLGNPLIQRIAAYLLGVSTKELAAAREHDRWATRVKWSVGSAVLLIIGLRFFGSIDHLDPPGGTETSNVLSPAHPVEERTKRVGSTPIFASSEGFSEKWPHIPANMVEQIPASQIPASIHPPTLQRHSLEPSHRTKSLRADGRRPPH